jgi:hypothetical protein
MSLLRSSWVNNVCCQSIPKNSAAAIVARASVVRILFILFHRTSRVCGPEPEARRVRKQPTCRGRRLRTTLWFGFRNGSDLISLQFKGLFLDALIGSCDRAPLITTKSPLYTRREKAEITLAIPISPSGYRKKECAGHVT